ncbi:MAG: hypothetical protein JO100_09370 [Pseudonocardia sp.]|nr:hypothetical protein [Pseudonocardia sp.]
MDDTATFLPFTLATISAEPRHWPGRGSPNLEFLDLELLNDVARRAEWGARNSWRELLGGCSGPAGQQFPARLRLLSGTAAVCAGPDWWGERGRPHRDWLTRYESWIADALAEGDGAGFAQALAGYDASLAGALLCSAHDRATHNQAHPVRTDTDRVGAQRRTPSRRMTGWARQTRAVTH